ncbi:MAG: hypothetical protein ACI9DJ_002718 [Algoriphagus sp.]|jgi:hypothetical protein
MMPPVIAGVTLISRKWGNGLGGVIASLPWVAGPILFFMAIEQGSEFAQIAIPGVLVGIISWLVFCFTYILIGQKHNILISVLSGYTTYLLTGALIENVAALVNVNTWFLITLFLIILSLKYFPHVKVLNKDKKRNLRFEIILRMIFITSFVIGITYFADLLGPTWSGILTPFPIMTAVLAIFVHYTQGITQVRTLFIGFYTGVFGFTTFLYLQAHLLPIMSIGNAFMAGLVVNVLVTLIMRKVFLKIKLAL